MSFIASLLRGLRRPTAARAAGRPRCHLNLERLESRETPSGGLGGGGSGGFIPVYYLPPGSIVPVQVAPPAPSHGHGGADVPQIKT